MKKSIAILLLVAAFWVGIPNANAARVFDGSNDYMSMADNDALTLPAGDWTIGCMVQTDTTAGTDRQTIVDNESGNVYIEFVVFDASNGTVPRRNNIRMAVGDGTNEFSNLGTGAPFASNTNWTAVYAVRSGNTLTNYVAGSADGSVDVTGLGAINGTVDMRFGSDAAGMADQFWDGGIAECAAWNRALSGAELTGLAGGFSPRCYPIGRMWYVPHRGDLNELQKGIAVTNGPSTAATTIGAHPRTFDCGE